MLVLLQALGYFMQRGTAVSVGRALLGRRAGVLRGVTARRHVAGGGRSGAVLRSGATQALCCSVQPPRVKRQASSSAGKGVLLGAAWGADRPRPIPPAPARWAQGGGAHPVSAVRMGRDGGSRQAGEGRGASAHRVLTECCQCISQ